MPYGCANTQNNHFIGASNQQARYVMHLCARPHENIARSQGLNSKCQCCTHVNEKITSWALQLWGNTRTHSKAKLRKVGFVTSKRDWGLLIYITLTFFSSASTNHRPIIFFPRNQSYGSCAFNTHKWSYGYAYFFPVKDFGHHTRNVGHNLRGSHQTAQYMMQTDIKHT